jgi:uncharacterized SAM-binding protein YcdF (DUF218 family)
MTYDVIILLGSQPDLVTWEFPGQVHACVDRTRELLAAGRAPYVITSGKWSIAVDTLRLQQPFRECDALADLLIAQGVDPSKILKEEHSQDTISNLYYLKTGLLLPRGMKHVLFVVADFRIPRLQFLCERILGPDYVVDFEPIKSQPSASYNEPQTFKLQKDFLEPMQPGDHEWLTDKFFSAPMYQQMAKLDRQKYVVDDSTKLKAT